MSCFLRKSSGGAVRPRVGCTSHLRTLTMAPEKTGRGVWAPRLGHAGYRRERWMWNGRRRRQLGNETAALSAPPAPPEAAEVALQETPLQKAERVTRGGEAIVERQKQLILDLKRNGRSTDEAEKL